MDNSLISLIKLFPDKPWNWQWLSRNPNMTIDIVLSHPELPWDFGWLSNNKFLKDPIALKNHNNKMRIKRTINRILKYDFRIYKDINSIINLYL